MGRLLAESLSTTLPRSVREKAVNAVWTVLSQAKLQQENQVFFHETEHGILVECHISDGASDMMTITLRVPDTLQAGEIKKRFQRDPLIFYRTMTALLAERKKWCLSFYPVLPSRMNNLRRSIKTRGKYDSS